MDLYLLKKFEGEKVTIILNNNDVYPNITYKLTSKGTIEFKDIKKKIPYFISTGFIKLLRIEKNGN